MRNRLLSLALVGLAGQALAAGVFISEYYEGAPGTHKALELYNGSLATVDLSDYALVLIANSTPDGVTTKTWNNRLASAVTAFNSLGTALQPGHDLMLDPGETFTLFNSAWTQNGWSTATKPAFASAWGGIVNNTINFNGDDAIALCTGSLNNWTVVDAIGVELFDPGTSWTISGNTSGAVDHSVVRATSVCEGTTDWYGVGTNQWVVYSNLDYSHLGNHDSSCFASNMPPAIGAVTYAPQPLYAADPVYFDATVTDSDGTILSVTLHYGYASNALGYSMTLTSTGSGHYVNEAPVPAPAACQALFFRISAIDDDLDETVSGEYSAPVECIKSIYEIQGQTDVSPYNGVQVITEGQITYIQSSSSMFIQEADGPWSGIQIFGSHPGVVVGDWVRVKGTVLEYQGFTEITSLAGLTVVAPPAPYTAAAVNISVLEANDEAYESVLVAIHDAECMNGIDEIVYDGTDQIKIYAPFYDLIEESCYDVRGIRYSYNYTKEILVRDIHDIHECDEVDAVENTLTFELGQAWPNPFNPSTQIAFTMDRAAQARLSVYNVLGQEVAVLRNGLLEAGEHQVRFDASNLPSGLYLYQLQSEGRQLTGRMLLVR